MKLKLVQPNKKYLKEYQNLCRDFIKNDKSEHYYYQEEYKKQLAKSKEKGFLKQLSDESKGINLKKGYVPQVVYWAIVGSKLVGRVNLRTKLNKKLRIMGGNIGTAVRPSERNKGHAKEMVRQVLIKAKKLGLKKILRNCHEVNYASRKVIEETGGVFVKNLTYKGDLMRQYVVKL